MSLHHPSSEKRKLTYEDLLLDPFDFYLKSEMQTFLFSKAPSQTNTAILILFICSKLELAPLDQQVSRSRIPLRVVLIRRMPTIIYYLVEDFSNDL